MADAREKFWTEFDNKLQEAATQKLTLTITSAYNSADERSALIDLEVRLRKDGEPLVAGRQLLQAASNGDFGQLLAQLQPELVRIHEGLLTHRITQAGSVNINIAGWHRNFDYSAAWRVITQSQQQIRTSPAGVLTVFTEVDMTVDSERRRKRSRSEEAMHTNFVLRYLGETHGAIAGANFDAKDKQYAIEVITGQTAQYGCTFTDDETTPEELTEYLAFAKVLGLDKAGAAPGALVLRLDEDSSSWHHRFAAVLLQKRCGVGHRRGL